MSCKELYKDYKKTCYLDVFNDKCDFININMTIEELTKSLSSLLIKYSVFNNCKEKRIIHTSVCHNGKMDYGHKKQLELLEKAKKKCIANITQIKEILKEKERFLQESKNTLRQIEKLRNEDTDTESSDTIESSDTDSIDTKSTIGNEDSDTESLYTESSDNESDESVKSITSRIPFILKLKSGKKIHI